MILKAMEECHCKINPQKTAKPQAIGFINELKKVLPIDRQKMRLKITCGLGSSQCESLRKWLADNHTSQHVIHSETV
jgi:ribosome maturation protein Sdo1